MERVSPIVHLTVLTCVLVVNLPIFPLLYRRSLRLQSIFVLFRQPQTWIMISNSTFVFSPVILLSLVVSKMIPLDNDTRFWLAIDLFLRLSITCATISEFLHLWNIFKHASDTGPGWFWRRTGPVATLGLILLKFVPLIDWRDEALHFWTVFGATIAEFMLFGSVYLWTLIKSQTKSKWRNGLAGCFILCSAVVLLASICLSGERNRIFRRLLLEILSFLINTFYSLRNIRVEIILATRAHKENRKRISDEVLNESVGTLNRKAGADCRRPSTSTSRKQLTSDTDNATELYAAYFRMTMEEGNMIGADSGVGNGCVEENINRYSTHINPKESSPPSNPQRSCSKAGMSPPLGWLQSMTDFTQNCFSNGEDLESVRILLETEWPQMIGRVEVSWLRYVTKRVIVVDSDTASSRSGLGHAL